MGVWVGRISPEKRPEAILEAFEIIHQKVPEATLTIVGAGDNDYDIEKLQDKAYEMQIEESVEFAGFQKDVGRYYKRASVLAITSVSESFSLVLAESRCYGIPTVMYELPNLEMLRNTRSIVSVPQNDIFSLAEKIIELLLDDGLRSKMGKQAQIEIRKFLNVDVAKKWKEVFESFEFQIMPDDFGDRNESLVMDLLFKDFFKGAMFLISTATQNQSTEFTNIYNRLDVYDEVLNRHEEVVNRHEEVVNRHEEVVNRHEEVVNRHEKVINDDWAWLKNLDERISNINNSKRVQFWKRK